MTLFTVKIELSAYVEGLEDLRHLCYFLEGDGTDMPFVVAERIKKFTDKFPEGQLKVLPSTNRLIQMAIDYAITQGGFTAPSNPREKPRTFAQIKVRIQAEFIS